MEKELEKIEEKGDPRKQTKSPKPGKGNGARGKVGKRGKDRTYRTDNKKMSTGGNDFAFWNEYPDLMSIATRFPWMHVSGTRLTGTKLAVDLPNVAVQEYHPIPGIQYTATSPLNLAFRKLYLDMHRKYRGIGSYQASDIAITMLCIESALQKIVEAERIYGILNRIPVKSRIQPFGLLRAMGYNTNFITNVNQNLADFRYGINRLIDLAKRLPLPAGMSFCANHISLNGFVYADSKDERADLLVFISSGFFEYLDGQATGSINASGTAQYVSFVRNGFNSYTDLLSNIESSLTTLLYDSDILKITSDFISCYGENNMQVLMPLPEDYAVTPTYDESILLKWHNSERGYVPTSYVALDATTTKLGNPSFSVYQQNDVVISWPLNSDNASGSWLQTTDAELGLNNHYVFIGTSDVRQFDQRAHVVDTWESDPSEATACESVLWKVTRKAVNAYISGQYRYYNGYIDIGTEMMGPCRVYRVVNSSISGSAIILPNEPVRSSDLSTYANALAAIAHFDWHPVIMISSATTTGDFTSDIVALAGDTDNVSNIESSTMKKIIDAALLSAYSVKISASGSGNKE